MTIFATKPDQAERAKELVDGTVEALAGLPENTLDQVSDAITHVNSLDLANVTNSEISNVVGDLAFVYFNLRYSLSAGANLWRTRKTNPGILFEHTDELAYPPRGGALGRVAHTEQAIFYAASSPETTFTESRLKQGDSFHLIRYEVRPDKRMYLAAVGEIDSLRRSSRTLSGDTRYGDLVNAVLDRLPPVVALSVQLIDAFYADWFGRKGDEEVYRVSNAITREFLSEAALSGVVYPSVEHRGGFNYAITGFGYDKSILPIEVRACAVRKSYGYGAFSIVQTEPVTIAEFPGKIQWPPKLQEILNSGRHSEPDRYADPN